MQIIDRRRALAVAPLWRLGFRPFFLFGAAFAALAVACWWLALSGLLADWQPTGGWLAWHRHEMPLGFGVAIVAGFLLTAVQNWTGLPGLSGRALQCLVALWAAARLAWLAGLAGPWLALLDGAFLPLLALILGRALWRRRQWGNAPLVGVLLVLSAVNGVALIGLCWGDEAWQRNGALAALWLLAVLMGTIGGRVLPFFTARGLGRVQVVAAQPRLDIGLLLGGILWAVLQLTPWRPWAVLPLLLAAGHAWRLWRWYDAGLWRVPLLWSLHLAMAWLALAYLGAGLSLAGLALPPSSAVHALGVGAMGGLILAMIARVSLGHTGRSLQPPRAVVVGFVMVNLAALARVFFYPLWSQVGMAVAALAFVAAFAAFLLGYAPMLCRARVDGHPG